MNAEGMKEYLSPFQGSDCRMHHCRGFAALHHLPVILTPLRGLGKSELYSYWVNFYIIALTITIEQSSERLICPFNFHAKQ